MASSDNAKSNQHVLKIHPAPLADLMSGAKTAEVRRNDRGFQVGDTVRLMEVNPETGNWTGADDHVRTISHIQTGYGLPDGMCVLSYTQPAAGDLKRLSVTNILLNVVPGPDGMGHEVYAESVEQVERRLCDLGDQVEYLSDSLALTSAALAKTAAPPAAAHGDEAVRWVSCSERLPDVANGGSQHFLVNVYRAHSGESSVFEAHFLRDYPLYNEALGDETGEYLATGWFNQVPDIEFDEYYEPVVRKESGDEVTHWMPMPAPAAMRAQGDGVQV